MELYASMQVKHRTYAFTLDSAANWLGPCTSFLEAKMIAREQARVWGGPDAAAVGDTVCLTVSRAMS